MKQGSRKPLAPRGEKAPVGKKIGRWTVLGEAPPRYGKIRYWRCVCQCGIERDVARASLLRGESQSCGCKHRETSDICVRPDCGMPTEARSLCHTHYRAWLDVNGPRCSVLTCDRPVHGHGLCALHCAWLRRYGKPEKPRRQPRPPSKSGYVHASRNGQTKGEHIWLMEDMLGRPLARDSNNRAVETVHHVNGIKHDNTTDGPLVNFRSGNLELWSSNHPSGQRVADKVTWATDLLRLYAPRTLTPKARNPSLWP